jgi:hypothetical protein
MYCGLVVSLDNMSLHHWRPLYVLLSKLGAVLHAGMLVACLDDKYHWVFADRNRCRINHLCYHLGLSSFVVLTTVRYHIGLSWPFTVRYRIGLSWYIRLKFNVLTSIHTLRWSELLGQPCSAASYSICSVLIVLVQYWMCTQYYQYSRTSSHSSAFVYITLLHAAVPFFNTKRGFMHYGSIIRVDPSWWNFIS